MQRYFFQAAYRGTHYRGWQRQSKAVSVQETIESALSKLLKTKTLITGCGRTDAKVHAQQYFFHADIAEPWDYDMVFRLNSNLPKDIVIIAIIPVAYNAHARRDAISRSYQYYFHLNQNPFLEESSVHYPLKNLNIKEVTKACKLLTEHNNYIALCKTPERMESTICKVSHAELTTNKTKDIFCFEITANRFLRGMVRAIVQELLNISQGTPIETSLLPLLKSNLPSKELKFAHPQGLYLTKIKYPYQLKTAAVPHLRASLGHLICTQTSALRATHN